MLPRDLQLEQFRAYPPQARALVASSLPTLRQLPLSFLPSMLRELIDYDYKFPAERSAIDGELTYLHSRSVSQLQQDFQPFAQLKLSAQLESVDWVNRPGQFVEEESAYLWSTHQLDAFREAATRYGETLRNASPPPALPLRRLGIAVVGQGVASENAKLFRKLRPHGTYFTHIKPENGTEILLMAVEARAQAHPVPYAHWYIDGGQPLRSTPTLTSVSYQELEPLRAKLLAYMQAQIARPGMGPEELRSNLARLAPGDLGMDAAGDAVLQRFHMKLFTEGSGTQIFSTTFAQWTTREALRRAEPLTLLARFAPRQRQRDMNEMISNRDLLPELDPAGSLVDADMAAYYHWINQQRLAGADQSSFLIWFEGHAQALVIAPTLPRGVHSDSAMDLKGLLALATS